MNLNQQQQIESYLAGEMSAEEISAFESQVEVNPELRQELHFQSEVISGIGEFRKAQLIARLDGLNVSTAWWSVVQHSSVLQYAGSALAIIGIGGAAYWYTTNAEEALPDAGNEIVVDAPVHEPVIFELPEFESQLVSLPDEVNQGKVVEALVDDNTPPKEEKSFNPIVNVPNAGNVEAEKEFQPQQAPKPEEVEETEPAKKALEVEVVETKTSRIKYRYYAGKLFLYGKFQDEPYQILEINSAAGRRIYLHHLNTFYEIVQSDKPVNLTEVTNEKLIQELSILRKSK